MEKWGILNTRGRGRERFEKVKAIYGQFLEGWQNQYQEGLKSGAAYKKWGGKESQATGRINHKKEG